MTRASCLPDPPKRPILLFDVMDTLVVDPYAVEMPRFFGLTMQEMFALVEPGAWVAFESAQITEAEYLQRFFRDRRSIDRESFRACLFEAYRFLDGIEALLQDLVDAGFSIYALSNYPVWYEIIEEKLQLSRFLRWDFVSWKTGRRKPDPSSYIGVLETLGVAAHQGLFFDDRAKNCRAASALGIPSFLFTSAPTLRLQLEEKNLLLKI